MDFLDLLLAAFALIAVLVLGLAIIWPLDEAAVDDVMQKIHGDQPRLHPGDTVKWPRS